ncbi:MAG: hypothetical protein IJS07_08745 [Bacteroidales bacterium]|nr:hypothetical protein [Bacteroidales bacterium]
MKAKLLTMLLPAAVFCMTACEVDETYDLGQKPDLSMTFFEEGLAVPIGNSTGFKLGDFITPGTELTVDAGGFYSVSVSGNPAISQSVSIPSVSVSNIACTDASFEFPIPAELSAIPAATWAALVTDYPYVLDEQEATTPIAIQATLPDEIDDIAYVDIDAPVTISFRMASGKMTIKSGFTITFPDCITLTTTQTGATVESGHIFKLTQDMVVSTTATNMAFKMTKITVPNGAFSNHQLTINDNIAIKGSAVVNPIDFASKPDKLAIDIQEQIGTVSVTKASVKLNVGTSVSGTDIDLSAIGDIKDQFSGTVDFILSDPVLKLTVQNDFPFGFNASGLSFTTSTMRNIAIPAFTIPAAATTDIYISRAGGKAAAATGSAIDVVVPNLSDLIRDLPESITMSGVTIALAETGFVDITVGNDYTVAIPSYGLTAPLALDQNSHMTLSKEIDGINLSLNDLSVKNASLGLDLENSIPFNMEFTVTALNEAGEPIDVGITAAASIPAGTIANPTTTPITIEMKEGGANSISELKKLKFNFEMNVLSNNSALNKDQGIAFKNMYASVAGVGGDLGAIKDKEEE